MSALPLLVGPRTKPGAIAILREARRLVARPHGWTQGRSRRARPGHDDDAFCALGALGEAKRTAGVACGSVTAETAVANVIGARSIAIWNDDDNRKQREVVAAFDAAIQLVEADRL